MSFVWLASYPKSGNTWVRAFLTNYIRDADEPVHINDLDGGWYFLSRADFDDTMGLTSSDMTDDELNYYRSVYHCCLVDSKTSPIFMKSHGAYCSTYSGKSRYKPVGVFKAIHIVRNPLDVAVSFAHHDNKCVDEIIEKMANPRSEMYGGAGSFKEVMGDWSSYNNSWLSQEEIPLLTVRYEDLQAATEVCFSRILEFIGIEINAYRLKKAIAFSSFEQLQSQENQSGFRERQPSAESFFRNGVINDWMEKLTREQAIKMIDFHRKMMVRLGYETQLETIDYPEHLSMQVSEL